MQRQGAVRRTTDQNGREMVSVHVAVIGQHSWSGNRERRVFIHTVEVIDSDWRIIDRLHGNGDCRWNGVSGSITRLIRERLSAVVVWLGGVNEAAVRRNREATVRWQSYKDRCERVCIHVAVIGQDSGGGN